MSNLTKMALAILCVAVVLLGYNNYRLRVSSDRAWAAVTEADRVVGEVLDASQQENVELKKSLFILGIIEMVTDTTNYQTAPEITSHLGFPLKINVGERVAGSSFGVNSETGKIEVMGFTGNREDWVYPEGILQVERRTPSGMEGSEYLKVVGYERTEKTGA